MATNAMGSGTDRGMRGLHQRAPITPIGEWARTIERPEQERERTFLTGEGEMRESAELDPATACFVEDGRLVIGEAAATAASTDLLAAAPDAVCGRQRAAHPG